ncbi:T9SS type A sorting domain-containing, partial [Paramuricea clavata]
LVNDKPTNIAVANITSRSAVISWLDPKNHGRYGLLRFRIKLKKNVVIRSLTTRQKVNEYKIDNLTPHTTYEISVAAGNYKGYSEGTITTFLTSEE